MTKYTIGDTVRIKTGPFNSFKGRVEEVWDETLTLKVRVWILGRPSPVSLKFDEVEKITPGDTSGTAFPSHN